MFPSGGGDWEALSGIVCQRLQVQYHPQHQWWCMWPLPTADSFPGVWIHRCWERKVSLHSSLSSLFSDTKSSPLSYQLHSCLFVKLLKSCTPHYGAGSKGQPSSPTPLIPSLQLPSCHMRSHCGWKRELGDSTNTYYSLLKNEVELFSQ